MITFEELHTHVLPQLDLDFEVTRTSRASTRDWQVERVRNTAKKRSHEPFVLKKQKNIQDAMVGRRAQTAQYVMRMKNRGKPNGRGQLKSDQYTSTTVV